MGDLITQLVQIVAEKLQNDPQADVAQLVGYLKDAVENNQHLSKLVRADSCVLQINQGDAKAFQTLVEEGGIANVGTHFHADTEILRAALKDFFQELQAVNQSSVQVETPIEFSWQEVSSTLLQEQLNLTTNLLTMGEGIAYRTEQIYVPLGLVERKKQPRRKGDVSPEQGSDLYSEGGGDKLPGQKFDSEQETHISQRFEYEQFLEKVLHQGQSPKSQGKRIAIIGEPGAGKTTLLQQIAQWVAQEIEQSVIIWVSLGNLQGQKLKPYLFETWLNAVAFDQGQAEGSATLKDGFVTQFNKGRVWLLLDGVDEMQLSSSPLSEIEGQIRQERLLQQARIVLTCRLNLWDGNQNALTSFDTYRTLDFSYPQQVEQFIGQWFRLKAQVEQGQKLCQALKQPGRERIRDLVKNPLRLTLLCFDWSLRQGKLPETKAELYQQFVQDIYEWKQEQFPVTSKQQHQLNVKLAELSREAIDKEPTRFRLRHKFVCRFLGDPDEGSLFRLALNLGWLNKVGVDVDHLREAVYAFFHPTFEEYFAALTIDGGSFFLNHIPDNPNAPGASYRLFEPQWKQVFLLWLGRSDVEDSQKENLIESLVNFEDGCQGCYWHQAFFLASIGVAEFKECKPSDEIVERLVWFGLGYYFDEEKLAWMQVASAISAGAKAVLQETDIQKAIWVLVEVLETAQNQYIRSRAADSLGEIGTGNDVAIGELVRVLGTTQDEDTCRFAVESLEKIGTGNDIVIQALVRVMETTQDEDTRWKTADSLGKLDPGNDTAIRELVRVLGTTQDEDTRVRATNGFEEIGVGNDIAIRELVRVLVEDVKLDQEDICYGRSAVDILQEIGTGNDIAIRALVRMLETAQDEDILWRTFNILEKIGTGNDIAIRALVRVLETAQDEDTLWRASSSLAKIGTGNDITIRALVRVLETTQNKDTRKIVAFNTLALIDPGNDTVIRELVRVLETTQDEDTRSREAESLEEIGTGNDIAIRQLVRVLETTQDDYIRSRAAESLEEIGAGNDVAIGELVRVLETTQDDYARWLAAESLKEIDPGNNIAIRELVRVLETTQDGMISWTVAGSLEKIGFGNDIAVKELVRVLETTQDDYSRLRAAKSLGTLDPGNGTAIRALVQVLETSQDDYARWLAANSLGKLDPGNNIAIRELVWVLETTQDDYTRSRAADSLGEIGTGNDIAIRALVRVLETTQDEGTLREAFYSLAKIGTGNDVAIRALVRVLETTQDEDTLREAFYSLAKIDTGNDVTIRALVRVLETIQDNHLCWWAADSLSKIRKTSQQNITIVEILHGNLQHQPSCQVILECADKLLYTDFYRAFNSSISEV